MISCNLTKTRKKMLGTDLEMQRWKGNKMEMIYSEYNR